MITTVKVADLEYLVAENIAAPHCFTTRLGGVSEGYLSSLNLGAGRGDKMENMAENYRILADTVDFDVKNTVLTHQIHTDIVRVVTKTDHLGLDHHAYPQCDALVTNDPGTALVVFTADCTPILLWDPETGAVGAAHAGWRGTAAGIAGKTAETMVSAFGCDPKNIRAAIGPNIAQRCFQTDADVPNALLVHYGKEVENFIRVDGNKYYVNLKEINALSLRNASVGHIEISTACTACQNDRFWSHRKVGNQRGSQGAIIVCKGGHQT